MRRKIFKLVPHQEKLLIILFCFASWIWLLVNPPLASAQFKAWVMAKLPDTPEGLGIDSKSNIYAALFHTGEVVMVKDDGSYEHIAWVPSKEESGTGTVRGLDVDKADNIYVAYKGQSKYDATDLVNPFHPSCRDATVTRTGVYKIDAKTRKVTALATKADGWPFCFPNDLAIDSEGNVYMSDLTYSGIWKISPDGKKVDLWSAHQLLNWSPRPFSGYPLGVNDIVLDKQGENIYAVTDGDPMVLRIPIEKDGTAGEPQQLKPGGSSIYDGVELDAKGNIYVSEILRNEIWVISPDGSQRILIANKMNAPLDNNTSLVLKGDVLCTANLGFVHQRIEDSDRTVVCMQGFAVPTN
ncbi:MAG: SMP-30/gluconolactonase/LRE family protein [Candidatus Acidiferrales bacterium]|jgi:sugar lactone lactonase YvrE